MSGPVLQMIDSLRRRDRRMRGIDRFLEQAFILSLAVAGLLLVDRIVFELELRPLPIATPAIVVLAFAAAFGLAATSAFIATRRPADPRLLAWRADKMLGTDEALLTTLELSGSGGVHPFTGALTREAAKSIDRLRPEQVVPATPVGYRAGIALSLLTAAALLALPPILIDPPRADFIVDMDRGLVPLDVTVESLSSGAILDLAWDFGDGATATGRIARHRYEKPGRYSIRLVARGPGGRDEKVRPDCVEALDATMPVARFEADPPKGRAPLTVSFRNLSQNASAFRWQFGDDLDSTDRVATHTYVQPGRYTVTLTAGNASGNDVAVKRDAVIVVGPDAPLADFRGMPRKGSAPLEVRFEDLSSGPMTSWEWDFGDPSIRSENSSSDRDPIHTYRWPGRYTVRLTVTGPGGADSMRRERYIEVEDGNGGDGGGGGSGLSQSPPPHPSPSPGGGGEGGGLPGRLFEEPTERPVVQLVPEGVPIDGSDGELVEKIRNVRLPGPGGSGEELPYSETFSSYRHAAEETMRREKIPPALRDYVKRYFDQVKPR